MIYAGMPGLMTKAEKLGCIDAALQIPKLDGTVRAVGMRFLAGQTQREISGNEGISQQRVSAILQRLVNIGARRSP